MTSLPPQPCLVPSCAKSTRKGQKSMCCRGGDSVSSNRGSFGCGILAIRFGSRRHGYHRVPGHHPRLPIRRVAAIDAVERAELPSQLLPIAALEHELRKFSGNSSGTNHCDVILVPRTSVSRFPFFNAPE